MWSVMKLFLHFRIVTAGEWFGKELYMVCTVPNKDKFAMSSKFLKMWILAAGQKPSRRDRMSTAVFRNKVFRAKIRVVTDTAKQKERPIQEQYSVIDSLLEVMAGGGQR